VQSFTLLAKYGSGDQIKDDEVGGVGNKCTLFFVYTPQGDEGLDDLEWINLAEVRYKRQDSVKAVITFRVLQNVGYFVD
jgi:hypothetical protein